MQTVRSFDQTDEVDQMTKQAELTKGTKKRRRSRRGGTIAFEADCPTFTG
jgi:hypothetical protein